MSELEDREDESKEADGVCPWSSMWMAQEERGRKRECEREGEGEEQGVSVPSGQWLLPAAKV